jgi:uncharacterized protein (TIGR02117 family)
VPACLAKGCPWCGDEGVGLRNPVKYAIRFVGTVLLLLAAYVGAALLSATFLVLGRTQVATIIAPIFVCADDVHADFVFPALDADSNWQGTFPTVATPDLPPDAYLTIGWGDLVFFTEIPNWGDVRPQHVIAAFAGTNPVALRVVATRQPQKSERCFELTLDRAGRQALADYVKASAATGEIRQSSKYEIFVPAKGRYGPFHTCNQWIANGLAAAGAPHAWFSPFSFGVTWPLKQSRAFSPPPTPPQ